MSNESRGSGTLFALAGLAFAAALVVCGTIFTRSGLQKKTDVYPVEFTVSGDGSELHVVTALSESIGYLRDMKCERVDNQLYVTFYGCFGGLNSKIGAKSLFTLPVDEECDEILFYRGGGDYETVLKKHPVLNKWVRVRA